MKIPCTLVNVFFPGRLDPLDDELVRRRSIAIDRIKRAGDPSIKLVDHDPVRIRMNI